MKRKQWLLRGAFALVLSTAVALGWLNYSLPDTFYLPAGEEFALSQMPWLQAEEANGTIPAGNSNADVSQNVTLTLWGAIPVKNVRVVSVERRSVMVSGAPFGIKMFSDGALVVGFSDVLTENGYRNPAKEAGVEMGDRIICVNGKKVRTNDELTAALQESTDRIAEIDLVRDGDMRHVSARVERGSAGGYKLGMWVRDSSAGIGTLTFYGENGVFAGLGHAISDSDTGRNIELLSGEIVPVSIVGAIAGAPGTPGELKGQFRMEEGEWGKILNNCTQGVYGVLEKTPYGKPYEIAAVQEIVQGYAQILSTIDGNIPRLYDVQVEHISMSSGDPNKNMVIRVKDDRLLQATGGIVQGMSGSPILQNGRLIGAVTHVLVNDPTRGYGIFAENMLRTADGILEENAGA